MKQITKTKKSIPLPNDLYVETNDLTTEIGKYYLERLWKNIELHEVMGLKKIYFIVKSEKNPLMPNQLVIRICAIKHPLHFMREQMDHWEYDYVKNKLKILWSVPHRVEMKNFLRAPEKYNPDIIKWIKQYLHQEKINLNDSSSIVIEK